MLAANVVVGFPRHFERRRPQPRREPEPQWQPQPEPQPEPEPLSWPFITAVCAMCTGIALIPVWIMVAFVWWPLFPLVSDGR